MSDTKRPSLPNVYDCALLFVILFCNLLKIEYLLISIHHPQALGPSSNENKDCPTPTYDLDSYCENRMVGLSGELRISFAYRKIYNIP